MLFPIVSTFSLAIILGFSFVSFVLRKSKTSGVVTALHFLLIASALILLWHYFMNNAPGLTESFILLTVALGSMGMLYAREIASYTLPRWLVLAHGAFSILGIAFLVVVQLSR